MRLYCFESKQQIKPQLRIKFLVCQKTYIVMSNEIESLIKIYPVAKPTVRSETVATYTFRSSMPNNYTVYSLIERSRY